MGRHSNSAAQWKKQSWEGQVWESDSWEVSSVWEGHDKDGLDYMEERKVLKILARLCGTWQDTKSSTYTLSFDGDDTLEVKTKRPTGRAISTSRLIRVEWKQDLGRVVWGRAGGKSVYTLGELGDDSLLWKRNGSAPFRWYREEDEEEKASEAPRAKARGDRKAANAWRQKDNEEGWTPSLNSDVITRHYEVEAKAKTATGKERKSGRWSPVSSEEAGGAILELIGGGKGEKGMAKKVGKMQEQPPSPSNESAEVQSSSGEEAELALKRMLGMGAEANMLRGNKEEKARGPVRGNNTKAALLLEALGTKSQQKAKENEKVREKSHLSISVSSKSSSSRRSLPRTPDEELSSRNPSDGESLIPQTPESRNSRDALILTRMKPGNGCEGWNTPDNEGGPPHPGAIHTPSPERRAGPPVAGQYVNYLEANVAHLEGLVAQMTAAQIVSPFATTPAGAPAGWQVDFGEVVRTLNHYFSDMNLQRDDYLRGLMQPGDGWVSLALIQTFPRMKQLGVHLCALQHAVVQSPVLELDGSGCYMRIRDKRMREGWAPLV